MQRRRIWAVSARLDAVQEVLTDTEQRQRKRLVTVTVLSVTSLHSREATTDHLATYIRGQWSQETS